MKNENKVFPWCFPCNFFMFLSLFLTVKFVFIFVFNGFYEPEFIFNLTPLYFLSGFNELQLLFFSFVVVVFDLFLHTNPTNKNIRISFFVTLFLLSGSGLKLTMITLDVSSLPYLIVFLCLLFVMIIDNKFILEFEDLEKTTTSLPLKEKTVVKKPLSVKPNKRNFSLFKPVISTLKTFNANIRKKRENSLSIKSPTKAKLGKWKEVQSISKPSAAKDFTPSDIDDIDIRSDQDLMDFFDKKLENLDRKIKELQDEKYIEKVSEKDMVKVNAEDKKISDKPKIEKNNAKSMLEEIKDSAAIIKKGVLKQINLPFEDFLGYNKDELLEKNLIDFISYEGLSGLENYYFKKLKHEDGSTFETVFLTKDNKKVNVKIQIKTKIVNGEKVNIAIIKKI